MTYQFENGKLVNGAWLATDHGKRYYYGPGFVQGKWYTIEGNLYFFNQDGYRYEGLRYVKLRDNHDDPIYWYDFGEDGICHGVYQHTGLFYLNGNTYYTINGMVCNGLYLAEDGYYYYFGSVDYTAVKNTRHWVSYPNDTGFAPAFYSFDEDGRMIIDTPDPSKDGIVNEDGELYYYVNGVRFYAGLIQIDGDYYYVNSSCKVVTNQRYWVSKTNDLLPAGFYNFDVDGKMTDAPIPTPDPDPDPNPDPEVKNGIVSEDGELYYYVNGVKTYAGLIQIDGDYYYVNSYCKVITNQRYWVSKTKDLLILTEEMEKAAGNLYITTDDGSFGIKGMVTGVIEDLVEKQGRKYDVCVAIGPMIMMKFVCLLTKKLEIPTIVSLNPIMVDGTGMCGACRVTVGDQVKFACVDGPEFDGHLVNFDEAMERQRIYKTQEGRAMLRLKEGDTHHGGCGQCGGDK